MRTRSFRILTGLLATAAAAIAPQAAGAATVTLSDPPGDEKFIYVEAEPGENNDIEVTPAAGAFLVSDQGNPIEVDGCSLNGPTQASCPSAGIDLVNLALGNGFNQLNVTASLPVVATGSGAVTNIFYSTSSENVSFTGSTGNDILFSGYGDDDLFGRGGEDTLDGGTGNDELYAGEDDDILHASEGADVLDGDEGWDTVDYSERSEGVAVSLDGLANDGWSADGPVPLTEGDNVTETVEEVHGTSAADKLIAGAGRNELIGFDGGDRIKGGAGIDVIAAGRGRDRVKAKDSELDGVDCGPGKDRLKADPGDQVRRCEPVGL